MTKFKLNKNYRIYNQQRKVKGKDFIHQIINETIDTKDCEGISIYSDKVATGYRIYYHEYNFGKNCENLMYAGYPIIQLGKDLRYIVNISWKFDKTSIEQTYYHVKGVDLLKYLQTQFDEKKIKKIIVEENSLTLIINRKDKTEIKIYRKYADEIKNILDKYSN